MGEQRRAHHSRGQHPKRRPTVTWNSKWCSSRLSQTVSFQLIPVSGIALEKLGGAQHETKLPVAVDGNDCVRLRTKNGSEQGGVTPPELLGEEGGELPVSARPARFEETNVSSSHTSALLSAVVFAGTKYNKSSACDKDSSSESMKKCWKRGAQKAMFALGKGLAKV